MIENSLIEVHVISPNKDTLLDIDCSVGIDTTISDILEIIFTNYDLEPEKAVAMYAFIPFVDNPMELQGKDCLKTLREMNFSNGITFRIIYVGDTE